MATWPRADRATLLPEFFHRLLSPSRQYEAPTLSLSPMSHTFPACISRQTASYRSLQKFPRSSPSVPLLRPLLYPKMMSSLGLLPWFMGGAVGECVHGSQKKLLFPTLFLPLQEQCLASGDSSCGWVYEYVKGVLFSSWSSPWTWLINWSFLLYLLPDPRVPKSTPGWISCCEVYFLSWLWAKGFPSYPRFCPGGNRRMRQFCLSSSHSTGTLDKRTPELCLLFFCVMEITWAFLLGIPHHMHTSHLRTHSSTPAHGCMHTQPLLCPGPGLKTAGSMEVQTTGRFWGVFIMHFAIRARVGKQEQKSLRSSRIRHLHCWRVPASGSGTRPSQDPWIQ